MRSRTHTALGSLLLASALLGLTACGETAQATWSNGIRRFEGGGRAGAEQGLWTYWYRDGQMRQRGGYDDGLPEGVWTEWWSGGQRASEGERRLSSRTGASERAGPWIHWHGNGQKRCEGEYLDGLRTGEWVFWKETGEKDLARCGRYEGDRRAE